jgi:hypothetical protein
MTTKPLPCDSPAVRKRSTTADTNAQWPETAQPPTQLGQPFSAGISEYVVSAHWLWSGGMKYGGVRWARRLSQL